MRDPRELGLAEAIKNKMIAIQKSEEIYPQIAKLREKILQMSDREIKRASRIVASIVHPLCMARKASGKPLSPEMVNNWVQKELKRIKL